MYGRTPDGSIVFLGPVERPAAPAPGPPTYRVTAQPVHAGISFVNAGARSPSPSFRPRPTSPVRGIPVSFSFSEPPRRQEAWNHHGRSAVDPMSARGKRPVACAAWAHNHPIQNGARPVHKMDSVAEESESASALTTPTLTHRVPLPRPVPTIPARDQPSSQENWVVQERRSPVVSPNHSPLSPTRIVRSKPREPPAPAVAAVPAPSEGLDVATVATVAVPSKEESGERFPSNPQDGHISLDNALEEIRRLRQQNQQLLQEAESKRYQQTHDADLAAKNARLERDAKDMLQQFEEFEREKEDEVKEFQEEIAQLNAKLAEKEMAMKRYRGEVERERENLLQAMTDESCELQGRVEKLEKDKEALQQDLAKSLAKVDVLTAGKAASSQVEESQLRGLQTECEALKDEVINKDGQIILLRSQLEIADRKLRLSDMENAMLKSELELRKRSLSSQSAASTM